MEWSRCGACGIVFGSLAAFDRHRVGSFGEPVYKVNKAGKQTKTVDHYTPPARRCLSLEEIQTIMKQNVKGWWILGKDLGKLAQLRDRQPDANETEDEEPVLVSSHPEEKGTKP